MRTRINLMVAVMAVMVAVFATAAYAATIIGTDGPETLNETSANDLISGKRAADVIDARLDRNDQDELLGGKGTDTLYADDGDGRDTLRGGKHWDKCYGDPTDSFALGCEEVHTESITTP
jgi:Ca2+-binding RTX toxin-like protein